MITLRGKLTRTLVERPSSVPIATRSVRDAAAGDDGGVAVPPSDPSATSAGAGAGAGAGTGIVGSGGAGVSDGGGGDDVTQQQQQQQQHQQHQNAPNDEKQQHQQQQLMAASADSSQETTKAHMEMVEEWTWRGVWAFGNLPDEDDFDENLLGLGPSSKSGGSGEGGEGSADNTQPKSGDANEVEANASTGAPTAEAPSAGESASIPPPAEKKAAEANNTDESNKSSSGGILQKITSLFGVGGSSSDSRQDTEKKSEEDSKPDASSSAAAGAAEPVAATETNTTQTKDETTAPTTSTATTASSTENKTNSAATKPMKPRPFSYRFQKNVEAKDITVPSSLVVVVAEEDSSKKDGTGESNAQTDGGNNTDKNVTADAKPKSPQKKSFGDDPFDDAGQSMKFGTCPRGGKWEGHFENVVPNATNSKKKRDRKDNRVREMFYLFFNATPPSDARTTFPDDKAKKEGNADELRSDRIHVRGMGSNRFGTFEIVGSYLPKTGVLHCQRMYVITPSPTGEGGSATKTRGRRRRSVGGDGTVEEKKPRKRKSSLKKRELDNNAFEEYPFPLEGGAGSAGTPATNILAHEGDLVDKVKKRSRKSMDNAAAAAPASQSAVSERSASKFTLSKAESDVSTKSITSAKSNFSEGKIATGTASSSATPKASTQTPRTSQSATGTKSSKKPKPSPFTTKTPIAESIAPLNKIVDLPTCGDPMLGRWRSAHFLYYQRVDQSVGEDNLASTSFDANAASADNAVQVNFVVYEGEMHDMMREGRGICLYNNNTMYEGFWKKNKEHGKGTLMTADRSRIIYQGDWERGRMHGSGTYNYYKETPGGPAHSGKEDGRYTGEFRENLRNGMGLYVLPDGSSYDGEWRENNMNGWGVFRWPDGSVYEGFWKDGRRHGASGRLIASDGFKYEGAWANNGMEGRGIATYPNGQIYEGMWVAGRREGRGTIRFTNGAIYEGRFKDDYMEGQGTLKMNKNVIIPKIADDDDDDSDVMDTDEPNLSNKEGPEDSAAGKNDWMIPIEFQSDISHIHQKAGFTQVGL